MCVFWQFYSRKKYFGEASKMQFFWPIRQLQASLQAKKEWYDTLLKFKQKKYQF